MFQASSLLFWYAVAPVHMGVGTAVGGLIDNPIQREVHTAHPVLAGSGLKGALRERAAGKMPEDDEHAVFGPESGNADAYAGALSVSDAQIVAFPVRALKAAFVWVTCPTALARLKRLAEMADVKTDWEVPGQPGTDKAVILSNDLASKDKLILEAFAYGIQQEEQDKLKKVADWLAKNVLPEHETHVPFRDLIRQRLVLVRDEDFGHFVRFSTAVEPHVRINNETGTADDGGLFYTENLPPETIMASLLMASPSRKEGVDMSAQKVLEEALSLLHGAPMQVGGDATTGRGLMVVNPVQAGNTKQAGNAEQAGK